ncbi:MAG: squalene/phytoene synthase family protein, partial [Pseudomonadota bacterium]
KDRWARRHAIDLGIAMQLTNIARDVAEDATLGRRYLPASWVDVSPSAILNPSRVQAKQVQDAIARLLDLAEVYYSSGRAGLDYLPGKARTGIAVAAAVYREIGIRLHARGCDHRLGRVVVPRWRKALVTIDTIAHLPSRRLISKSHDGALHVALKDLHGQEAVEAAT